MEYHLAIDIGASSGRHIVFWKQNKELHMHEVYRFKNETIRINKRECWDVEGIVEHILKGLSICKQLHKIPTTLAIDTWGVDYVLLDEDEHRIEPCIAYRDHSFDHSMEEVHDILSKEDIYQKTGIQFQQFNTIYQLYEQSKRINMSHVKTFLMMPDYFNYRLTGKKANEYTNATTTQLLNAKSKQWDTAILKALHIPKKIFPEMLQPCSTLSRLSKSIQNRVGFDTTVLTCASHDTGSAFLTVHDQNTIIISSGTWSLIGIHVKHPIINSFSMKLNYTNEGGYKTIRFLKNIMGLWMLQEVSRDLKNAYTFDELCSFARASKIDTIIDVNDAIFLKPEHMMDAIQQYCRSKKLIQPSSIGDYVRCICHSLAVAYQQAIHEVEFLTNRYFHTITILGGGSQNTYLNEWIKSVCHKEVVLGETEATAYGNALSQMYYCKEVDSLHHPQRVTFIQHQKEEVIL